MLKILSQWQDACGKFECAKKTIHGRTLPKEQNNVTKSVFVFSRWRHAKQGNRLTPRPCNGDEFEITIFEAKGQNVGICGICQSMFAI